jgi:DNA (cytosine-5)-methyltransferase 1
LENAGYEVQPFVLPACAVNAPHQRYRVWFVAHAVGKGSQRCGFEKAGVENGEIKSNGTFANVRTAFDTLQKGIASDTIVERLQGSDYVRQPQLSEQNAQKGIASDTASERTGELRNQSQTAGTHKSDELFGKQHSIPNWDNFPTESPVCCGDDGLPTKLDNITIPKWRRKSIESYGNAVVPQIPYQIFSAINNYENLINSKNI